MRNNESPSDSQAEIQQLLDQRFTPPDFRLQETAAQPYNLSPVMQIYAEQLLDLGFIFSHELHINRCVGKPSEQPARMLVYMNPDDHGYALLTDLYHTKNWVYFTHYYSRGRRLITTCQPGALLLEPMRELGSSADFFLQNTGSSTLATQWKKHQQLTATRMPAEDALLMDAYQHLDAEREAYRKYTDLLIDCTILRLADTELVSLTHTGARSYHAAITSRSARRPQPKIEEWIGSRGKVPVRRHLNYRNAALAASAVVAALLVANLVQFQNQANPEGYASGPEATIPQARPVTTVDELETLALSRQAQPTEPLPVEEPQAAMPADIIESVDVEPEQFLLATDEDEMWRIAVENAEFFLMSNDGDPAPWIRTARKMAAGFPSDDSRLARTYFLAALLERDPRIAEQQYNRALSIQTKSLGLYHAETAQTLEALAWIAEGSRDALDDAITHQRLALNIYRSIFGEEAEDTRAARWKLQYFEDRLAGLRPKSDDNRRLLPALARFTR